jgi:hypothetical protein
MSPMYTYSVSCVKFTPGVLYTIISPIFRLLNEEETIQDLTKSKDDDVSTQYKVKINNRGAIRRGGIQVRISRNVTRIRPRN